MYPEYIYTYVEFIYITLALKLFVLYIITAEIANSGGNDFK